MATVTDLFGLAEGELRLALNYRERAIETHSANFNHADHDCKNISSWRAISKSKTAPDRTLLA